MEKKEILEALKKVYDPEYPASVLELGIVREEDVAVEGDKTKVQFTPTSPFCPMGGVIGVVIKYALEKKVGGEVEVKVKPGTHAQESYLNELLQDKKKYEETLNRLRESGLLDRCLEA